MPVVVLVTPPPEYVEVAEASDTLNAFRSEALESLAPIRMGAHRTEPMHGHKTQPMHATQTEPVPSHNFSFNHANTEVTKSRNGLEMMTQFMGESEKRSEMMHQFMGEPEKVKSQMSFSRPQTHQLPTLAIWTITLAIPFFVGVVNFVIVVCEHGLGNARFKLTQDVVTDAGVGLGTLVLVSMSALMAAVATCLVTWVGPMCAGSGLPEAKGYLNGNIIPNMFSMRNLFVRIVGITLACAAGYPVGREGPMVCIGGTIGYQVVDKVAARWVRRWVNLRTSQNSEMTPALMIDEERLAHAKRIGCALGGAAGVATAFNAPIGGILYMFEEVTVTSWPSELTFRAFVCTVLAAFWSRGLLNLTHDDVHHLVIFDNRKDQLDSGWTWEDVPFFFLLAIFVGLYSAIFTRVMLVVWNAREKFKRSRRFKHWKKFIRAAEAIAFVMVCALAFSLLPLLIDCVKEPGASDTGLSFVRHDCPQGEHREVASLLLTGPEKAVKQLFSRHFDSNIRFVPLLLAIVCYTLLACAMPGLPVPLGCFVPCLLIGAMLGRFVGEAANETGWKSVVSHPGVYALVGSAAMLSGFTHMTIAIVVLLVEAAADLSLVSPIMLGIFVASLTAKLVNPHAYDEVLILRKGVPFLDEEVPEEMDRDGSTAADLCDLYPDQLLLGKEVDANRVIRALEFGSRTFSDFPVIENRRCIGLTTRSRLEAAVSVLQKEPEHPHSPWATSDTLDTTDTRQDKHEEAASSLGINGFVSKLVSGKSEDHGDVPVIVPVHRIMDKCPYTIMEDMPAARFYPLFVKAGVTAAVVTSNSGEFVGVLKRANLISQSREDHVPVQQRRKTIRNSILRASQNMHDGLVGMDSVTQFNRAGSTASDMGGNTTESSLRDASIPRCSSSQSCPAPSTS